MRISIKNLHGQISSSYSSSPCLPLNRKHHPHSCHICWLDHHQQWPSSCWCYPSWRKSGVRNNNWWAYSSYWVNYSRKRTAILNWAHYSTWGDGEWREPRVWDRVDSAWIKRPGRYFRQYFRLWDRCHPSSRRKWKWRWSTILHWPDHSLGRTRFSSVQRRFLLRRQETLKFETRPKKLSSFREKRDVLMSKTIQQKPWKHYRFGG